jgi:CheY-like chemotaxis protein
MARILLVDDNAAALEPAAMLLMQWGHDVRVASDGATAVTAALAWLPDVVLLDIGLPGMDGFQVAAALRREPALAACRVIAMSGMYSPDDEPRLAVEGIDQLLRKPLDLSFLRSLLGYSVARSRAASPATPAGKA